MNDWRPSYQIAQIMQGYARLEDASPAIQSAARLPIHQVACEIMKLPKPMRREAIDKHPARLVPHIEAELIRMAK